MICHMAARRRWSGCRTVPARSVNRPARSRAASCAPTTNSGWIRARAPWRTRSESPVCSPMRMTSAPDVEVVVDVVGPVEGQHPRHQHRGDHDRRLEPTRHRLGLVGDRPPLVVGRVGVQDVGESGQRESPGPAVALRQPVERLVEQPPRLGVAGRRGGQAPAEAERGRVRTGRCGRGPRASWAASRWRRSRAMNSPARSWASARSRRSSHASSRPAPAGVAEAVVDVDRPGQEPHGALVGGLAPGLVGGGATPADRQLRRVGVGGLQVVVGDLGGRPPVVGALAEGAGDAPVEVGRPRRRARRPGGRAARRRARTPGSGRRRRRARRPHGWRRRAGGAGRSPGTRAWWPARRARTARRPPRPPPGPRSSRGTGDRAASAPRRGPGRGGGCVPRAAR